MDPEEYKKRISRVRASAKKYALKLLADTTEKGQKYRDARNACSRRHYSVPDNKKKLLEHQRETRKKDESNPDRLQKRRKMDKRYRARLKKGGGERWERYQQQRERSAVEYKQRKTLERETVKGLLELNKRGLY